MKAAMKATGWPAMARREGEMKRLSMMVVLACALAVPVTVTAVPGTIAIGGALHNKAGGPVTDGNYKANFAIYAAASGGKALWSEAATLKVSKGAFKHALGVTKPVSAALVAGAKMLWLGVSVAGEPELARSRLHSVPTALVAATAANLACTGCVSVKALKFDGDLDLGGRAIKAAKITTKALVSDTVQAKTVAANSFVGDGSKLTGLKIPAGACAKKGHVVRGINKDGSLVCVPALDPSALPADGLNEISNDLLSNQFNDSAKSTKAVPIIDNSPLGVKDTITFPDVGLAQKLTVSFSVENSKVDKVKVNLIDPAGKTHTLYAGANKGTKLNLTFPPAKQVSGDLGAWIGKNAKGKWTLHVIDQAYLNNKTDGRIVAWSVTTQTLSGQKVAATKDFEVWGNLWVKGNVVATGSLRAGKDAAKCTAANAGAIQFNGKKFLGCNGKAWAPLTGAPDGSSQADAASSCAKLHEDYPGLADGDYWLDLDGGNKSNAAKYRCDMKNGGWTRIDVDTFTSNHEGWSSSARTTCGSLGQILGGYGKFGNGCVSKDFNLLATHTQLRVKMDYIAIDSWDGENARAQIDGSNFWSKNLSNCSWTLKTNYCGNGGSCHEDQVHKLDTTRNHTGSKVRVSACSSLNQSPTDESFGVDNVEVWIK